MNWLFTIISFVFAVKDIAKESIEPAAPANRRFDWDAYYKDIRDGISPMEQVEKRERGGYWTIEPLPKQEEIIEGVVDMGRYMHDLEVYGRVVAEMNREQGVYKYIVKTKRK